MWLISSDPADLIINEQEVKDFVEGGFNKGYADPILKYKHEYLAKCFELKALKTCRALKADVVTPQGTIRRWDIEKSTALKIQYDKVEDNGVNIPILGDSETIALGIDIVF